ncbi:MAG: hydrolase [Candidatus Wallacebacter cryptica]
MLERNNSVLVLVDAQTKLMNVMDDAERLIQNLKRLIKGMQVLGIPLIVTEQYPKGLGPTIPELTDLLNPETKVVEKITFSCTDEPKLMNALEKTKRKQVILCGVESHICVYQTALGLRSRGYDVEIAADAVSSRSADNRKLALFRLAQMGVGITGTEMVLFELLRRGEGDQFKAISKIVK